MKRKITALFMSVCIFGNVASASVLGNLVTESSTDIADGVIYNHNRFMSEQEGVGFQSEHYAIYTPNEDIQPVIISGEALWGRETITEAEEYMRSNALVPMIGINASYFSYETGLAMGHIISDGLIMAKDTGSYQAIGFEADGSAFIMPLSIKTSLTFEKEITYQVVERIPLDDENVIEEDTEDIPAEVTAEDTIDAVMPQDVVENEDTDTLSETVEPAYYEKVTDVTEDRSFDIDIAHINKYNQKSMDIVNLYTSDFDKTNHSEGDALTLILGDIDGEMKLGEKIDAVVEEKFYYDSSIEIPEDKLVITVNKNAKDNLFESLDYLEVGDKVSIMSSCNDIKWEDAVSAIGSVGETLVSNGVIPEGISGSAAPRTAVGITKDGDVIFYVIDGRQQDVSYGARLETLAQRMLELGCVDAINLDGGGSTVISGIYPGCDVSEVFNSPSGGSLRPCSNYIFLHNTKKPTETFSKAYFYPNSQHYLSGYSEEITVKAVDTEFYKTEPPAELEYSVSNTESVYEDGILTASGDGKFRIDAYLENENVGTATYYSYKTPTDIFVYNQADMTEVETLNFIQGDEFVFDASSVYGDIELKSTIDCYEFSVDEEIGYFEDNKLVITSDGGEGTVGVTAGEFTKEIPVSVEYLCPFTDISTHWAGEMIKDIYSQNIISGYEIDESFVFMPDNNMTREEFAVIMGKFLGVDIEQYSEYELTFADNENIANWSRPYISAMYDMQIINGKASGDVVNFAPKDTITRAEAITIIGRTVDEVVDSTITFTDNEEIPDWAIENILKMTGLGYVSGYEDNTIRPNNFVTRAEAVTLLYKMLQEKEC